MTVDNLLSLLPLLILALAAALLLLLLAFVRDHSQTFALTLLVFVMAFAALFLSPDTSQVTPLLRIDALARFFMGLIFAGSFVVCVFSYSYFAARSVRPEELYILLLLATLGASVLVASTHFASFFLGLEILSVSLYALLAYLRSGEPGVEAGTKYLVLAGVSSAFLLFGMALVYAETGTMEFARITTTAPTASNTQNLVMLSGLGMMIVGIGFKLAVVPFHLWTPDVYQGAPAPITALVATVSKGAMFALLLRLGMSIDFHAYRSLFLALGLIAIASMIVGNLLALLQNSVKRILAYSSIAHLGYMLVAFLAAGPLVITAVGFYLVSYFVTTLGAFGVVTVLSSGGTEADQLDEYRGLFVRRPWLAVVFAAMLLSLAGIPLTAGFIGKFYLVAAGVGSELWLLALVLVLTSSIGLFYYLRIIVAMFVSEPVETRSALAPMSFGSGLALGLLAVALIFLGVYPTPLIQLLVSIVRT